MPGTARRMMPTGQIATTTRRREFNRLRLFITRRATFPRTPRRSRAVECRTHQSITLDSASLKKSISSKNDQLKRSNRSQTWQLHIVHSACTAFQLSPSLYVTPRYSHSLRLTAFASASSSETSRSIWIARSQHSFSTRTLPVSASSASSPAVTRRKASSVGESSNFQTERGTLLSEPYI